jgi:hypothetical protein
MSLPDFAIIGAPKCGTTALASYLGAHPEVFMSPVKEPNYFCLDRPRRRVDSLEAYQRLFMQARPRQICGEASSSYLYSDLAVPALLRANPGAALIAMVRDPLEMAVAYHNQKVYNFQEPEGDFERAWRRSPERIARLPSAGIPQHYLDYRAIGRLGEQIQRLQSRVRPEQLHVVVYDDLRGDPGGVYREALQFLGLTPNNRREFEVMNARRRHMWPALARSLKHPPPPIQQAKLAIRETFPKQTRALRHWILGVTSQPVQRPALSDALRREMVAAFADDVQLLGKLINRDLSHWLETKPEGDRSRLAALVNR